MSSPTEVLSVLSDEKENQKVFVNGMKNENTRRKTKYDIRKFAAYIKEKCGQDRAPETIIPLELDTIIAGYLLAETKANGQEYEPDSLQCMHASIHRYLQDSDYEFNIKTAEEFRHSRKVLASKRKFLKIAGLGNRKNRAEPFTDAELELLWNEGQFGLHSPQALLNTIWMTFTLGFGLRGRHEHQQMLLGDIELKKNSEGLEYIELTERATKTRQGQAGGIRNDPPQIFSMGGANCPVYTFKEFIKRRPEKAKQPNSNLYLAINYKADLKDSKAVWYKNQNLGKNSIGDLAKNMATAAGIQGHNTNHSARHTCVSVLAEAGIEEGTIAKITGHKTAEGLKPYKRVSEDKRKDISNILMKKMKAESKSRPSISLAVDSFPQTSTHTNTNNTRNNRQVASSASATITAEHSVPTDTYMNQPTDTYMNQPTDTYMYMNQPTDTYMYMNQPTDTYMNQPYSPGWQTPFSDTYENQATVMTPPSGSDTYQAHSSNWQMPAVWGQQVTTEYQMQNSNGQYFCNNNHSNTRTTSMQSTANSRYPELSGATFYGNVTINMK